MGKASKRRRRRAIPRAYGALRDILAISERYFNDSKFVSITDCAYKGLGLKKPLTKQQG